MVPEGRFIVTNKRKESMKKELFQIGVDVLEGEAWNVDRIPGVGKSSVRRITKNGRSRDIAIRTSQDRHIAFVRNRDDTWKTLSDVDAVVAVSVDDADTPRFALVHFIEGKEMLDRFDRAYAARRAAGHTISVGSGMWISLYRQEATQPVSSVGAGAGLANPPIARVALQPGETEEAGSPVDEENKPLTIADAKRGLAISFGVDPSSIKITIEA